MIELENDDDNHAKQEMISLYRRRYQGDERTLETIDQFENESLENNVTNAIRWYTQNSCIFRHMNEVLLSGNISDIYSHRYLIKLLCRQLKDLHRNYKTSNSNGILHLYRGQRLKLSQILRIAKHKHDLISINSFMSTTLEEDIAKRFCFGRPTEDDESVMFEINIDLTANHSIDFANISHISKYPYEEEILLSIGSIFRIESVDFEEERQLYRIQLSLNQHEQLKVNEYIEQTYAKELDSTDQSILFGKLLFDMGECQFAIKYFQNAIEHLSDNGNHNRATYLNNIGVCYNELGEKDQALKYYKTAIRIYGQTDNHRGLGACYHNVIN
jgi:tetratricopeptide (TPR) repeat protein